jgi:Uma2 family endonuclease
MSAEHSYVPPMTSSDLITAEELLHLSIPDKRAELVANYVRTRELGVVYAAETGFTLAGHPDTVRAPDVAFVSREHLPSPEPVGFPDLAPDLVVEVLSPGERPGELLAKIADWLSAGTRLVWVIDPERRLARVYRQDGTERIVAAAETLDGEDVVPGFSCPLSTIL